MQSQRRGDRGGNDEPRYGSIKLVPGLIHLGEREQTIPTAQKEDRNVKLVERRNKE